MITSVDCPFCEPPHFSHFECSACGGYLGVFKRPSSQLPGAKYKFWSYCPFCGASLEEESPNLDKEKIR